MAAKRDRVIGANAERARSHNRQVVLDQVRAAQRIGRAEIARNSGLSTQAVSNIIAELIEDKLLVERGRRVVGRGMPVVQYGLNPAGGFAFGVEIRPDAALAALLDLEGRTLFMRRQALTSADPDSTAAAVAELRDAALSAKGIDPARLLGAGIVMPGPFGATGIRDSGSELPGWQDLDPRGWFSLALGLPVYVENDANAAALAERITGTAKGLSTYAFLYFGAGLGLGMVSQGRIVPGAFGNAGEIGHIPVPSSNGAVRLETVVSRLSVQRALREAGIEVRSSDDLDRLYAARNPALMKWLDQASEPLSAAITILENLLDPQAVILGGAMPDAVLDHLIGSVTLTQRSVANRPDRTGPRLLRGASGRMTATLGAAALVLDQTFTPRIAAAS